MPTSNASIERMHGSLKDWLRCVLSSTEEWDDWLELAMFSYNTSVHSGTKLTPFQCMFGRIARVPSDRPCLDGDIGETYNSYLDKLRSEISRIQTLARENLIEAKVRSKRYYDRKVNPQEFKVGEKVKLLIEPNKGSDAPIYSGPHKILEILNDGINAKISHKKGIRLVHTNKLIKIAQDMPSEESS